MTATLNSGKTPAPVYRKTRFQNQWQAALVAQMIHGGLDFAAPAEAVQPKHREPIPEVRDPLDRFLSGIMSGRVETQRRYCLHAQTRSDLLLERNNSHWLLGDADCLAEVLRQSGQDTRCDSCGGARPDRTPVITFEIGQLRLLVQLCAICQYSLGI